MIVIDENLKSLSKIYSDIYSFFKQPIQEELVFNKKKNIDSLKSYINLFLVEVANILKKDNLSFLDYYFCLEQLLLMLDLVEEQIDCRGSNVYALSDKTITASLFETIMMELEKHVNDSESNFSSYSLNEQKDYLEIKSQIEEKLLKFIEIMKVERVR